MTRVVNRKTHTPGADDVSIVRPGPFGNPYKIGRDGTREECIAKFRRHFECTPELQEAAKTLEGKTLVCCCKPKACHGDVYVDFINRLVYERTWQ